MKCFTKRLLVVATACLAVSFCAHAQYDADTVQIEYVKKNDVLIETVPQDVMLTQHLKEKRNVLKELNVGLTAGTTGLGVDLSLPLCDWAHVRAGFAIMPSFKHVMDFRLQVGDKPDRKYDENGNRIETRFEKMAKIYQQLTGHEVNEDVQVIGRPTFYNGKLLVDFFPFRNKKWSITAGVYYGNEVIAKAYNRTEDMPLLECVDFYNVMYDKVMDAYTDPYNIFHDVILANYNGVDIFVPEDQSELMYTYMKRWGRMGIHLGDYFLVPDKDCMVKASVKANRFKPYLGFGYGNAVPKPGKRYGLMVEAGFMMWGGTPVVDCYGTDLVYMNVKGRPGHYVDFIKKLKVFPVLNIKLTRKLFPD